jgi:hypothetical protein
MKSGTRGPRSAARAISPLAAVLLTLLATRTAAAQSDPEATPPPANETEAPHLGGQRMVGFGPSLGLNGVGGLVALGPPPLTFSVTGGYEPLLVFGNKNDPTKSMTLDTYGSAQMGADVAFLPGHAGKRYDFGLILGYRYNSLLAHGGGGGAVLDIDLTPSLSLVFSLEYIFYPQASDQLAAAGYPSDRTAAVPYLQGGANVGLLVYP